MEERTDPHRVDVTDINEVKDRVLDDFIVQILMNMESYSLTFYM